MKRIMVATPTIDGKLDCKYVSSLTNTIKDCLQYQIEVLPIYVAYDSLVQRARNDLMFYAFIGKIDAAVFIDSDISWESHDFIKLISREEDIVAGVYPLKQDQEFYALKAVDINNPKLIKKNGLCEVQGVGTGFIKLSKKAVVDIWNNSQKYRDENGTEKRMVFDVVVQNERIVSEDIYFCQKMRSLGYPIYIDPSVNCLHTGIKTYPGNFERWAKINNFLIEEDANVLGQSSNNE